MPPKKRSDSSSTVFSCIKCAKSFSSRTALTDHGRSTGHLIPCTIRGCKRAFTSQGALEQHVDSPTHQGGRPKQPTPRGSSQKIQASSTPNRSAEPIQTSVTASSSIAATMGNTSGQLRTSQASRGNVRTPMTALATSFPCNLCKRSPETAEAPGAHSKSTVHAFPHVRNNSKSSPHSKTDVELQGRSSSLTPSSMNEGSQPEQTRSFYESYTPYSVDLCYLVTASRSSGVPLISPLKVDGGNAFLLVPQNPQKRPQLKSSAILGNCKFCGLSLTSWESLGSHFMSSACSTLAGPSVTERGPINPMESLHERITLQKRVAVCTEVREPQTNLELNRPCFGMQSRFKWSVIPEPQQSAALAALASRCHSDATLVKNKYIAGPGYVKILGVEVAPSLVPQPTPTHDPQTTKRRAVALDCEMVGVGNRESEVARISAIDYITGEVLIDTLVQPTRPVTDWRTKVSGITKAAITAAVAEGRALKGWQEARAELWKYIDADTILVGQARNHDFDTLRIQHWRVVDSAILAKDAVGAGVNRQWGLKTLCNQLLGIEIQNNGKRGHDSVEDAFAAREVVLWCFRNDEDLLSWGRKQKEEYIENKKRARERKRRAGKRQKLPSQSRFRSYGSASDDEIMRWEDIADDCGWPHPDTGYDPWSD